MAEGVTPLSGSTAQGSDAIFLHECDSCKYDGTVAEGVGFCVVCEEFLCHTCLNVHKKSKFSRSHKILEGDEIDTAWRTELPDLAVQYCKKHKHKEVSDYCQTHNAVICEVCRTVDHRKCTDVKAIEDVFDGEQAEKKSAHILEETKSIIRKIKGLQQKRRGEQSDLVKQKEKCIQDIRRFREEMIKRLDEIETVLHTKINEFVTKQSSEINASLSALENLVGVLENEEKHMESMRSVGRANSIFIAIKNTGLPKLKAVCSDMENESYKVNIHFQADDTVAKLFAKDQLCKLLKLQSSATCDVGPMLMDDVKDKKITKIGEHCVKLDDDTTTCYVTGSKFLPTGELVMCDNNNKKLKLTDGKMHVQSSIKLPGKPWDVALVENNEAVVTIPDQHKLQFVTVGEQLTSGRSVTIGRPCYGIACCKDNLYVTCHGSPRAAEVLVLNKQGTIQTRISNSQGSLPFYIAVDAQDRIYLSDFVKNSVTCMSSAGQPVYTYTDGAIWGPGPILVDTDQYVYVCGRDSNAIQVITDKGHKYKTLMASRDVINLWSMAYRNSDKTLALGRVSSDQIVFYKFQ